MANEQNQNDWQSNKEMNPAENSSVTAGGEDTENTGGSWRATDTPTDATGEAQKPFGEDQDPADGQGPISDVGDEDLDDGEELDDDELEDEDELEDDESDDADEIESSEDGGDGGDSDE